MADGFDARASEFLALLRTVYDAGAADARSHMLSLLQNGVQASSPPRAIGSKPVGPVFPHGGITHRVMTALVEINQRTKRSVTIPDTAAVTVELSMKQVRASFKVLSKSGAIIRLSRGEYLPAPRGPGDSGAAAPGPVNAANFLAEDQSGGGEC